MIARPMKGGMTLNRELMSASKHVVSAIMNNSIDNYVFKLQVRMVIQGLLYSIRRRITMTFRDLGKNGTPNVNVVPASPAKRMDVTGRSQSDSIGASPFRVIK